MKGVRTALVFVLLLGISGVAVAGQMTLTRSGVLYRVGINDEAIVVDVRSEDGAISQLLVPQTTAVAASSLQVGVEEFTNAVFVFWQEDSGMNASVRLATYIDGTWIGPITIAGGDGTAAFNPQCLPQRIVSLVTEKSDNGEEDVETEVATTFLHMVWWSQTSEEDSGSAHFRAVPLDENGVPQFDGGESLSISDLLPYGMACFNLEDTANLKYPKLFMDPTSGSPHVFATDFTNCLFQIIELRTEVVEEIDDVIKRRRHIVLGRNVRTIALRSDLPLSTSKLEVGSNLSIIMHWDGNEAGVLEYLELDQDAISKTKTLSLSEELNHEQAVDLIRGLTR